MGNEYEGKGYYWIEDSVNHAISGKKVGLKSMIMDHPYNQAESRDTDILPSILCYLFCFGTLSSHVS